MMNHYYMYIYIPYTYVYDIIIITPGSVHDALNIDTIANINI